MAPLAWSGAPLVWTATAVLLVAVVEEVWRAAASFEVSFGPVPSHAQGQYADIFGIGRGLSSAAAPALLRHGVPRLGRTVSGYTSVRRCWSRAWSPP